MTSTGDTLHLSLGVDQPHNNRYLFSDHYLENLLPRDPRWEAALPEAETFLAWLLELYATEKNQLTGYNESQLEDHWIRPILEKLGHTYEGQAAVPGLEKEIKRPDYVFFPDEAARQAAVGAQKTEEYVDDALAVGEVKAWEVPLGKKVKDGGPSFADQNPSFQIYYYRNATGLDWGVLSNGRYWRLVHKESSQRLTIYYEVDLVDLLKKNDPGPLRYFTLFFRQAAFMPGADGRLFLDDVLAASKEYAVALEEDLKENVFQALEMLMQGFLDLPANNLHAGDLQTVYDNSLYLLYRLLFIFYAESRELLPLHNRDYREHYSLRDICYEIAVGNAPTAPMTTLNWDKVQTLFHIINGDDEDLNRHLGVPRYNGGLFDPTLHAFLEENAVGDKALVAAVDLLARRETPAGREFVDYRTLGVRQLGSIYEGLLEYVPRYAEEEMVAVRDGKGEKWLPAGEAPTKAKIIDRREAGRIYLATHKGGRKATGSYYTPAYIVEYIVENTLRPLVEEATELVKERSRQEKTKKEKEATAQTLVDEILDLKVLDPAMGSGHFLVAATEFLAVALATDPYVETEVTPEEDVVYWRRRVVERCIYGVDKNPLAVELAKLSLWLATVAADQPLSFLDHHLKCGDSLIGADAADLGWAPPVVLGKKAHKQLDKQKAGQMNIFEYRLSQQLPAVMGKVLEIVGQESDSYEMIQAKEAADEAVRQLKAPFEAVANLWVSAYFGHEFTPADYGESLDAIGSTRLWEMPAVQEAREMARERRFFHWELAFPEVFYDGNGQPLGDAAGFNAVIGNPPYVSHAEMRRSYPRSQKALGQFYPEVIQGHWDVFVIFAYRALILCREEAIHSFIVPSSLGFEKYATRLRQLVLVEYNLLGLTVFGEHLVFQDVARQYLIYTIARERPQGKTTIRHYSTKENRFVTKTEIYQDDFSQFSNHSFRTDITQRDIELREKIKTQSISLGEICFVTFGVHAYSRSGGEVKFITQDVIYSGPPKSGYKLYVEGEDLTRYRVTWNGLYLNYESKREYFHRPKFPELFESPKIMIRRISGENNRLLGHYDTEGFYTNDNIIHSVRWDDPIKNLQSPGDYEINEHFEDYNLRYAMALANSQLISWYFSNFIATGTLQDSYSGIYPEDVRQLPLWSLMKSTLVEEQREHILDKGKNLYGRYCKEHDLACVTSFVESELNEKHNDVIHDLLAFIVQEMVDMNREKQEVTEDFWLDLEGVTDPKTFDALCNKGKWEATLWKTVACQPFVDEGSHSSRHLDESLGWNEEAFKAFVKLLAGSVTNLSDLVKVYRKHHPTYYELSDRIARTDYLIDQIVYQLYGLTEEEIAIVEGEGT